MTMEIMEQESEIGFYRITLDSIQSKMVCWVKALQTACRMDTFTPIFTLELDAPLWEQ